MTALEQPIGDLLRPQRVDSPGSWIRALDLRPVRPWEGHEHVVLRLLHQGAEHDRMSSTASD